MDCADRIAADSDSVDDFRLPPLADISLRRLPRDLKIPSPACNLSGLFPFIPLGILLLLLPHFGIELGPWSRWVKPALPSHPVPWSAPLEAAYQIFHAGIWDVLDADDKEDHSFLRRLGRNIRAVHLCSVQCSKEKRRAWQRAADEAERVVSKRRIERWTKLYALHRIRQRYIEQQVAKGLTRETAILRIPGTLSQAPVAAGGSVWLGAVPYPKSAFSPPLAKPKVFLPIYEPPADNEQADNDSSYWSSSSESDALLRRSSASSTPASLFRSFKRSTHPTSSPIFPPPPVTSSDYLLFRRYAVPDMPTAESARVADEMLSVLPPKAVLPGKHQLIAEYLCAEIKEVRQGLGRPGN
ncbi:hypothetical protein JCM10213_003786 [Rhodosporidiobolus nylandii]